MLDFDAGILFLRAAQGYWRVAPEQSMRLEKFRPIARRAGEDGASRQSVRIVASGRFVQWRVAQLHPARRAPSM
ncbi:hypothetical protein A2U01_0080639, partial [Trifolium medium]|nr:hypothetical protein [Trifolium medium]